MTIKDLAKLAGVTHSTVSRSLNNSPLVSEGTRSRIQSLAREHGYTPNTLAQRLVTRTNRTIGLFFLSRDELDFMENFGTQFLPGITRSCYAQGYDLLLFTTPRDIDNTTSYLRLCLERHVEGVIFIGLTFDDPHLEEIRDSNIPVSIIDYILSGKHIVSITTDSQKGIGMAMEWLYAQGHRRIAFLRGPENSQVAEFRFKVYKERMEAYGLGDNSIALEGNFTKDSGYRAALNLMRMKVMPTVLLCANDIMALGAIKAFKEHGLRVPVDISVMGYDNALASEYSDPGLTTIAQDTEAIGSGAVASILARINGEESARPSELEPKIIQIEPRLVQRESVRRLPQGDMP